MLKIVPSRSSRMALVCVFWCFKVCSSLVGSLICLFWSVLGDYFFWVGLGLFCLFLGCVLVCVCVCVVGCVWFCFGGLSMLL